MFEEIHESAFDNLPFVLVSIGECARQGRIERPQGFVYHQFIWLVEGAGTFRMRDEIFHLKAGEGMFMRAGVPHVYYAEDGEQFYTRWCTFTLSDRALDYLGVGEYFAFSIPTYLERDTEQLLEIAKKGTPATRSAAGYAYVVELFSELLATKETLSERVLRILEQNYASPLTLLDISEELGIDRFALCRIYKQERGVTIMDDLNCIRIAKAKRYLRRGSDSVSEIGKQCGFESPSYFGKCFKAATGRTPTEYRNHS